MSKNYGMALSHPKNNRNNRACQLNLPICVLPGGVGHLDDCPLTVALPAALGAVAPIRPRAPNAVLVVPRKPGGLGVLVPWGETFDPLDVVFASANDCINLYYIVKSYHQSAIIHYD
jgi:hypothetical protein